MIGGAQGKSVSICFQGRRGIEAPHPQGNSMRPCLVIVAGVVAVSWNMDIGRTWAETEAEFGPYLLKEKVRPTSANFRPESSNLGPNSTSSDQTWPRISQNWSGIAQCWLGFGQFGHELGPRVGTIWRDFGQNWPGTCDRNRPNMARFRRNSAQSRPTSTKPEMIEFGANSSKCCLILANGGPSGEAER